MKTKIISLIILFIPGILLFLVWKSLPVTADLQQLFVYVPVKIIIKKEMLILFWAIPFLFMLTPLTLRFLDPLGENHKKFRIGLSYILMSVSIFLAIFNILIVFCYKGINLPYFNLVPVLGLLLIIFIGNSLGKLRTNGTVGFITIWTVKNELVWYKTHRFAANYWVATGIVGIVEFLIYPNLIIYGLFIASLLIIPAMYSSLIYIKQHKKNSK